MCLFRIWFSDFLFPATFKYRSRHPDSSTAEISHLFRSLNLNTVKYAQINGPNEFTHKTVVFMPFVNYEINIKKKSSMFKYTLPLKLVV